MSEREQSIAKATVRSLESGGGSEALERSDLQEVSYVEKALGLALLLVLVAGCIFVLKPFLTSIFLAVTLCVSTWPVFRYLDKWLGGRRTLAAALMTLAIACLLILPLVVLAFNLADDIARLTGAIQALSGRGLPPPSWLERLPFIGGEASRVWVNVSQQGAGLGPALVPYLKPMREWALHQVASIFSGTLQVGFAVVLSFFLFRHGPHVEGRIEWAMSRVGGWRARRALPAAGAAIKSVVNGVLGTALVQGILLGFSFWLAGVPGAIVIGGVSVVLTLLPMGILLLWLPAALWLMSQGHTGWAVFLILWNALFVGSLDNVLRPYLISRGISMPMVLIFLGVLGGLLAFGIVGVVLGPVLLSILFSLFQDWGRSAEAALETG